VLTPEQLEVVFGLGVFPRKSSYYLNPEYQPEMDHEDLQSKSVFLYLLLSIVCFVFVFRGPSSVLMQSFFPQNVAVLGAARCSVVADLVQVLNEYPRRMCPAQVHSGKKKKPWICNHVLEVDSHGGGVCKWGHTTLKVITIRISLSRRFWPVRVHIHDPRCLLAENSIKTGPNQSNLAVFSRLRLFWTVLVLVVVRG
jgi:hypothetical protein